MRKLFLLFGVLAVICSCSRDLVILHVNDTHSHLEPDHGGPRKDLGGVIERAAVVDSVRKAAGRNNTLLLHAGDFNQGSSYYSELGGGLEVDLCNALGYDCIALGNHEFDNGIEDLTERLRKLKPAVICANIDVSPFEMKEYVRPYAVLRRAGRKIGIIGLTSNLSRNVSATVSSRIPQLDNVEVTNKWAEVLRKDKKCDLVILLSHLGYREDQELIPQVRGLDLVIGGHSHSFVEDFVYVEDLDGRKVPVITDGCFGYYVGKVTVH